VKRIFGSKRDEIAGEWRNYIMRIFTTRIHKICSEDQIKNNEKDGACITYGGEDMCIRSFGGET
jgi:hypothetical protein